LTTCLIRVIIILRWSNELKRPNEITQKDGWYLDRVNGSHYHFKHKSKKGLVTVPHPRKDSPLKTVESIFRQAGL
jgi:toxin-antitoxin system, toxin component, hicA family